MRKNFLGFLVACIMLFDCSMPVFAYTEDSHNQLIEEVLFGLGGYTPTPSNNAENKLTALEDAVAICLDQFNSNYQEKLTSLNTLGVDKIPSSINDINFSGNQYHRKYTHRGWDFNYTYKGEHKERTDLANWPLRKTILTETVHYVFEEKSSFFDFLWFKKNEIAESVKQRESFAAFLYYLHVLGEYEEVSKKYETGENVDISTVHGPVIPLAVAHAGEGNIDIFYELERILPEILKSQTDSRAFKGMMTEISIIKENVRSLASSQKGITPDNFEEYCLYAVNLIELLKQDIPNLLEKEEFFSNVFY